MTTHHHYQNNQFQLDISDPARMIFEFTLQLASVSVVILYPSLCTPALSDGREPVRLLLLTKNNFHATWEYSQQKDNHQCQRMLQRFLHVRAWPKGGPQAKLQADNNLLLYQDMATAIEQIQVHYLGQLNPQQRLIRNQQDRLIARVDDFAIGYYNQHGFCHLFEVELHQFPALSPCKGMKLIDLNWIEQDLAGNSQSAAFDPALRPAYFEQQDELLLDFHQQRVRAQAQHAYRIKQGELHFEPDLMRPLLAHHPVFFNPKASYNFGHLTDVHISSRQHVFNKSNARIIPATDENAGSEVVGKRIHRAFDALYDLMDQFGRHHFTDGVVFTGDLIDYNRNYNPACSEGQAIHNTAELWQAMNLDHAANDEQYPNGIDNLIFYTLVRWFYDTYQKPVFLCAGNHEAYSVPYGISPRVTADSSTGKELLKSRPDRELALPERILAAVQRSIGIDKKRREQMQKGEEPIEGTRANEGIPADHNLTVYEACLMYGPQYYRTPMQGFTQGSTIRNFQSENLDWFQLIFTPFTDFGYCWPKQTLTLLAWGDDEVFMFRRQGLVPNKATRKALKRKGATVPASSSTLPRATQAIDGDQRRILDVVLAQSKAFNILAAHFTLINYHMDLSFQDTGSVGMGTWRDGLGYFDWGTFDLNREYLYRDVLRNRRLQVTLSGHSHRAGLYQLQDNMGCHAIPMRLNESVEPVKAFQAPSPERPRIVVSACGGPIAVQNYCDELAGKGMERPSGSLVRFDAIGDHPIDIKVMEARSPRNGIDTAKPRFCVAVDFVDLLKGDAHERISGVFDDLRLTNHLHKDGRYGLLIRFGPHLPQANLIRRATLTFFVQNIVERYPLTGGRLKPGELKGVSEHPHQYWFSSSVTGKQFDEGLLAYLNEKRKGMRKAFLSIEFDPGIKSALKDGLRVYRQYDFESQWIIPIDISDYRYLNTDAARLIKYLKKGDYVVFRHPVWGEIPEFGWYEKMDKDEYGGDGQSKIDNDDV